MGCRYDGQVAVLGRTLQARLARARVLMVGAGALGCEYGKGFAMMGLCTGDGGCLTVTDMDSIERSNLNRQFLFRERHLGMAKSLAAADTLRTMNPQMKVVALTEAVGPETEQRTFHDAFLIEQDLVCNALDNVEARRYVDARCALLERPLLESGTQGTKANSMVCLPRLTETYGDSRDPPEKQFAMCTMRHYPNNIVHCIEWARAESAGSFETLFTTTPQEALLCLADLNAFTSALHKRSGSSQRLALESVEETLRDAVAPTFDRCVEWARQRFEEFFSNEPKQLLHIYPPDAKTRNVLLGGGEEILFWSGPRRCPHPLAFDADDPLHFGFVLAAANLRAAVFGLPPVRDPAAVRAALARARVEPFTPQSNLVIGTEETDAREEGRADDREAVAHRLAALPALAAAARAARLQPLKFEKDDDSNFHVDYATATSNLRARVYGIEPATREHVKSVAGRIIPAMATTTAMITGLVLLEAVKLLRGETRREMYRNAYASLALPMFLFSDPAPPKRAKFSLDYKMMVEQSATGKVRMVPDNWTKWDAIVPKLGPHASPHELVDYLQAQYRIRVEQLLFSNTMIWCSLPLTPSIRQLSAQNYDMPLREVYNRANPAHPLTPNSRFLLIDVQAVDEEGEPVYMVPVKFAL